MPEETRTLTQISKEIEQAVAKITSAKATLASAQQDLTKLLNERSDLEADLLSGTGFTVKVLGASDGLAVSSKPRTRRTPPSLDSEPSTATLKAWAAETNWAFEGKKPSDFPKRLPVPMMEALTTAYKSANP